MLKKLVTVPTLGLLFATLTLPAAAQTNYADVGENFLTTLSNTFMQTTIPNGSTVPLYASQIDPTNKNAQSGNAELWTQDNMIRALYWATLLNPTKFRPMLFNAITQNNWYSAGNSCPGGSFGFGDVKGGTCFFDDNSLMGGTLMDVYLTICESSNSALKGNGPSVLAEVNYAFNYISYWAGQDPHGGVPQNPSNLGEGNFYMNPVTRWGLGESDYGNRFNNSADITIGKNYFTEVNNSALGLIDPNNDLFRQGTQYVNGAWVPNTAVVLGGDTSSVINLALSLWKGGVTADLAYAENLGNLMAAKWIDANGAVSQDGVNGGYAIVDSLCRLYQADGNQQWLTDAKGIIDFLINDNRDTAGWFGSGTDAAGQWDLVRTGDAPTNPTLLLSQSAAAAAILQFAYVRQGN